jgi:hypothetical protein
MGTVVAEAPVSAAPTTAQVIGTGNFSRSDSVWSLPENRESLAEAARAARQKLAKDRPRVFTNEDVDRLRLAAGEPPLGRPGMVTNERTMPASDVPAPNTPAPRGTSRGDNQQHPDGVQHNNLPASDQTTPPTTMNQDQQRPSPFRQKK